ncbi:MAG: CoA transferase, partial [Sorangiineae bacterium]|nr:CoA transferase [Sorangiineae bacterium]
RALEQPALVDDPRFARNDRRLEHRDELMPILERVFRTRATAAWLERLEADASARGRHDEARLYREARARLAVSGGSG